MYLLGFMTKNMTKVFSMEIVIIKKREKLKIRKEEIPRRVSKVNIAMHVNERSYNLEALTFL